MKSFLFILFLFPVLCYSQLTPEVERSIDSLKQIIATAEHDTMVINTWKEWSDLISKTDPELGLELNEKIVDRCQKDLENQLLPQKEKNYYEVEFASSHALICYHYLNEEKDTDKSIECFNQALKKIETIDNKQEIGAMLKRIAIIHKRRGDVFQAIEYTIRQLKVVEALRDTVEIAAALSSIGVLHSRMKNFAEARSYFQRSLAINKVSENDRVRANILVSMAMTYTDDKNPEKGIEYNLKALKIYKKIKHEYGTLVTYNNLGYGYETAKEYDKALTAYKEGLKLEKKVNNKYAKSILLRDGD